jgi:hypothetical protein
MEGNQIFEHGRRSKRMNGFQIWKNPYISIGKINMEGNMILKIIYFHRKKSTYRSKKFHASS